MNISRRTLLGASAATVLVTVTACSSDGTKTTVGIAQIVTHPSLDAIREGTLEGLKANGYTEGDNLTVDVQNPQGDQSTLTSIANTWASAKLGAVVAITTPVAQACAQAVKNAPIIFTGVTDPVKAGLVTTWDKPTDQITGISDLNPIDKQLALVKQVKPDAKVVGIVYSSSEANSQVQVDMAKEQAGKEGLTIKTATIANSSEIQQAAESLDCDVYFVPTDNTVVSGLEALIQVAEKKKRPIISVDADSVDRGTVAAYALDYKQMGIQTGAMVAKILKGTKPSTLPVETTDQIILTVNPGAATKMGVTLSDALTKQATKVVE
ncbi:ABC transporter substrate-binding protein [Luteococcus sanguinis]|uniref:ABC transporter substrate-binding protein n=1 Tax=Luteococcus sanguinis TaxID=174038 RepID=A0ABW1WZX0_9ACTN